MARLARSSLVVFLFVALVGVGVAGGTAGAAAKPSPTKIKVDARNFAFSPKKLKVKAGQKVTIVLHSTDSQHDFALEDGDTVVDVGGDKTKSGSFKLAKPGKYDLLLLDPGPPGRRGWKVRSPRVDERTLLSASAPLSATALAVRPLGGRQRGCLPRTARARPDPRRVDHRRRGDRGRRRRRRRTLDPAGGDAGAGRARAKRKANE